MYLFSVKNIHFPWSRIVEKLKSIYIQQIISRNRWHCAIGERKSLHTRFAWVCCDQFFCGKVYKPYQNDASHDLIVVEICYSCISFLLYSKTEFKNIIYFTRYRLRFTAMSFLKSSNSSHASDCTHSKNILRALVRPTSDFVTNSVAWKWIEAIYRAFWLVKSFTWPVFWRVNMSRFKLRFKDVFDIYKLSM
jgi:hypothetical protein